MGTTLKLSRYLCRGYFGPFETSLLIQLVLQFLLVSSVASSRFVFITLCRSQKVDRVPEYNKYCLSVRPPPFSIKGAESRAEEKESRARARSVTIFCVSLDAQISQGNGALISHCRMKIHFGEREEERPRESGRTGTDTSVGELQRNWQKRKEREKGDEETKVERRTIAFPRTFLRACVRACVGKPAGRDFADRVPVRGGKKKKTPMYKHDRTLILVFIRA